MTIIINIKLIEVIKMTEKIVKELSRVQRKIKRYEVKRDQLVKHIQDSSKTLDGCLKLSSDIEELKRITGILDQLIDQEDMLKYFIEIN